MNSSIDSLNLWGARFLDFAVPMLWQSCLLIAVVFALDLLLRRKIRAAVRYSLWFVVFVKLLVPPTLALPTGAAWWLRGRPAPPAPLQTKVLTVQYTDEVSDYVLPVVQTAVYTPPPPRLSRDGWILISALAISGFLAAWLMLRWAQVARCVRRTTSASDEISDMLAQACRQTNLSRGVALRVTQDAMSPAVCGLFKPVILLPQSLIEKLTPNQLRAVLLHELIHLRRLDMWVNCAQTLLQIVYWWNPLLWLANARVRRVREEAVDDAVMCALQSDAEIYAPTLLEVAKLAFSRPLASLGLVGILESRSVLRHRIERLLNFATPRRAGVSVVSVICLAAFTALAVPMGEPPARPAAAALASDSETLDAGSEKLIPFHANVNPEVFLRNIRARAGETMHTTNDDWSDILVSIMDEYGVDCIGERAITFNPATGEVTARNTSEADGVMDEVVKELNLSGGERILNPPRGLKETLIEAQFYELQPENLATIELSTESLHREGGLTPWWNLPSTKLANTRQQLKALGINPMSSPRIQTYHGVQAGLFVGDGTNNVRLECVPYVHGGSVNLSVLARTTGTYAPEGKTWPDVAGHTNCAIFSRVSIPDGDGAALVAEPVGSKKQLLVLLKAKIIDPAAKAGMSTGLRKAPDAATLLNNGKVLYQTGKLAEAEALFQKFVELYPDNKAAQYYLSIIKEARDRQLQDANDIKSGAQNVPGPSAPMSPIIRTSFTRTSPEQQKILKKLNDITFDKISYTNMPLVDVLKDLTPKTFRRDPDNEGVNFIINRSAPTADSGSATRQPPSPKPDADLGAVKINVDLEHQPVRLLDVLDAMVKSADYPIKYSLKDYGIEFSFHDTNAPELNTATFQVGDMDALIQKLKSRGGMTNDAGTSAPNAEIQAALLTFLKNVGVGDLRAPKSVFLDHQKGTLVAHATDEQLHRIKALIDSNFALEFTPPPGVGLSTRTFKLDVNTFFLALEKKGVIPMETNAAVSTPTAPSGQRFVQAVLTDSQESAFRANVQNGLLSYFRAHGVDLQAPKSIFFNDSKATLTFRATDKELDTIERLIDYLNSGADPDSPNPDEAALHTRTFKVDPNAFIQGLQSAGVFTNRPPYADSPELERAAAEFLKRAGVSLDAPKAVSYRRKDGILTVSAKADDFSLIEKIIAPLTKPLPEVTVKGRFVEVDKHFLKMLSTNGVAAGTNGAQNRILTEEQFKPILKSLNRGHANLLNEGEVTTLAGHQAQFQIVDVIPIVYGDTNKTPPYDIESLPFGTFLDVIAKVAADNHTIQLNTIPSVTEFLGYQDAKTGKMLKTFDSTKMTTFPIIRRRQTTMDAVISDSDTLILTDLGDEWLTKKPDGTVERKPFDNKSDKRLVVFVTPTIIDKAGNRVNHGNKVASITPAAK